MDFAAVVRVAMRTLGRNKLRTALTLLGITIGISAVICTVAIANASRLRTRAGRRRPAGRAHGGVRGRGAPLECVGKGSKNRLPSVLIV